MKKNNKIFYGKQFLDNSDIKSVTKALKSNYLSQGPINKKLEEKFKTYFDVKHALTCSSGTAALHLAFLAIGIKKNDYVLMPSVNFIASYNLCKSLGAKIILIDVDCLTGQIRVDEIFKKLKKLKKIKVKAIVNMMNGGYPQNLEDFYTLKNKLNCYLIDDSCHALGANYIYKGKIKKIGSCKHTDISTFSLHPLKSITSGEGGIITTNNSKIADLIKSYRSHGLSKDNKRYWIYSLSNYGFNFRLSEIGASLALSQLRKIHKFIKKRKKIAKIYLKNLSNYKNFIDFPKYQQFENSSFHLLLIHLDFKKFKYDKDHFFQFLNKKDIYPQFHYTPIYRLDKNINVKIKEYPGSEKYLKSAISLPIYYNLNIIDQNYVIRQILNYIKIFKKNKK
jgi:dTDP-4-amino-4,6-dideoxygalactose transaminase